MVREISIEILAYCTGDNEISLEYDKLRVENASYKYEINNHFGDAYGSLSWHIYDNGKAIIGHNFSPDFKRFYKIDAKLHTWLL